MQHLKQFPRIQDTVLAQQSFDGKEEFYSDGSSRICSVI